ncbi:hypothetical protein [Nocardia sp. X0981]
MNADNRTPGSSPKAADGAPSPHTEVTPGDLRRLLGTEDAQATLVLTGGRIGVATGADVANEGLALITRTALTDRVGTDPTEDALTVQAAELNTEIRLQGA